MDATRKGTLAIGTRFFETNPERSGVIERFVQNARECADTVLVAVNAEADKIGTLNNPKLKGDGIEVFPVTPWGKFIMPLNALVLKAALLKKRYLLLASAEMVFTGAQIEKLFEFMDFGDTLVVGAALEGHEFTGDKHGRLIKGGGRTVPWNTFALWNLDFLVSTGFPLIGDSPFNPENAGVEEVAAISVIQRINPNLKAKLIAVPGIKWDTDDFDEERRKKHEKKMQSKVERPQMQIYQANLPFPTVIHIAR